MSKKDDLPHFKIAKSIIGPNKDVKYIAGVSGKDWVGVWVDDESAYIVRYDWARDYYSVAQYKKGWLEVYAVEDLPSKYQKKEKI